MKKNVIILLLSIISLNVFAKSPTGDKVDPVIESKFKQEFGSNVKVSWEVIRDVSIATYTDNGEEKQVYYFSDGEVFGFGKLINRNDLPEAVRHSILRKFDPGIIQIVYEFKSIDSPTRYYVHLVTSRHSVLVSANEFGQIGFSQKERLK